MGRTPAEPKMIAFMGPTSDPQFRVALIRVRGEYAVEIRRVHIKALADNCPKGANNPRVRLGSDPLTVPLSLVPELQRALTGAATAARQLTDQHPSTTNANAQTIPGSGRPCAFDNEEANNVLAYRAPKAQARRR